MHKINLYCFNCDVEHRIVEVNFLAAWINLSLFLTRSMFIFLAGTH